MALGTILTLRYKSKLHTVLRVRKRDSSGYIYFYRGRWENPFHVKIGRATSVESRLKAQRTANPYGLRVLGVFRTGNAKEAEYMLHHMFHENKINREWFFLTPRLFYVILLVSDRKLTKKLNRMMKS
jgi:hypothetical protein